jgi:transcriptional regulator with GAF, ATPase, and Fis domain
MTSKMFDMTGYRVRGDKGMSIVGSAAISPSPLSDDRQSEDGIHGIIGSSPELKAVLDQLGLVAPTDSTVLIQGETGTGKELVARAVHNLSPRRDAPFIVVNCAAIPDGLLESELFGHERGAFTGAVTQRIGRFETADGGTLFLDEIGDISLDLQAKLLRVLQEKEFERLGSARRFRVDVRVVAATNCNLLEMIDERTFRADLYYRLSVFPILLPPLRERRDDIAALVRHFIEMYADRMNKPVQSVPPETMEAMLSCDWPGNIRELQNFIERGVIMSRGTVFEADLRQLQHPKAGPSKEARTLDDATRDHIIRVLDEVGWVIGGNHGAAARLGIPRTTLIAKMRHLGIRSRRATAPLDGNRYWSVGAGW